MPCRADRNAKRAGGWTQAAPAATQALACVAALMVAGCADPAAPLERLYNSNLTHENPIDWWHSLEGGLIAEQRPPPPGVTDPYPNLASVPARPVPTDRPTRRALAATLAAERDRTRLQAAQDPLVMPAPAPTSTSAPGKPKPATPDPGLSTATLEAATAAPALPSRQAPVIAPVAVPEPEDPIPAGAAPAAIVSGPIPSIPGAPPPPPRLPGLPPTASAPATPRPRPAVLLQFSPGSATLTAADDASLQELAVKAAGGPVAISAGGDASAGSLALAPAALDLAWRRVQAIGARLTTAGVTQPHLHPEAHADGRGGRAILID